MTYRISITLVVLLGLVACSDSRRSEWDSMDYARIAREYQQRENDSVYQPPSVVGCVDDDLYNCR